MNYGQFIFTFFSGVMADSAFWSISDSPWLFIMYLAGLGICGLLVMHYTVEKEPRK